MRYLDLHEMAVPSLMRLAVEYRRANPKRHSFGTWVRDKRYPHFAKAYAAWWLGHPNLFGDIYK